MDIVYIITDWVQHEGGEIRGMSSSIRHAEKLLQEVLEEDEKRNSHSDGYDIEEWEFDKVKSFNYGFNPNILLSAKGLSEYIHCGRRMAKIKTESKPISGFTSKCLICGEEHT